MVDLVGVLMMGWVDDGLGGMGVVGDGMGGLCSEWVVQLVVVHWVVVGWLVC